jgi:hypothetical protein
MRIAPNTARPVSQPQMESFPVDRKIDARLQLFMRQNPEGPFHGFVRVEPGTDWADLAAFAEANGFSLGSSAGEIATFHGADADAIRALAARGDVRFIEGSRPLSLEKASALDGIAPGVPEPII